MGILTFIQSTLSGTGAKSGAATADDEAADALEAGQAEDEGGVLEQAQDFLSDAWDVVNPLNVGRRAGELLRSEVEGAGALLGMGLSTTQEVAKAGQELGKAGQEGGKAAQEWGKAGQEWGKGSQQAAQAASAWSDSTVQIALIAAAALVLVMWLRQPPAGGL